MSKVKIWHNPRCGKSRDALKVLESCQIDGEIVKYLEDTPTKNEIKQILQMLNMNARELMRTKEAIYKELNLKNETSEERLIEAMVKNPKLIERPIIIKGEKAIIGRPTSVIEAFLKS